MEVGSVDKFKQDMHIHIDRYIHLHVLLQILYLMSNFFYFHFFYFVLSDLEMKAEILAVINTIISPFDSSISGTHAEFF